MMGIRKRADCLGYEVRVSTGGGHGRGRIQMVLPAHATMEQAREKDAELKQQAADAKRERKARRVEPAVVLPVMEPLRLVARNIRDGGLDHLKLPSMIGGRRVYRDEAEEASEKLRESVEAVTKGRG